MLSEGQQFAQYRIVRRLRSGGMGEVYLADDELLHRHVAIKVIRTDYSRYPDDSAQDAARLFLREVQAIAQLDHANILPVYGSGEENIHGTTFMYMVMPFRHEGSLADWLRKPGKSRVLWPRDVEHIVEQAASALQEAHDKYIIHQDVKPSNFLIYGRAENASELHLQLADFGVAKFMTTTNESQTIRGTPIYMAPEQWEGQPRPETDQYALAVMAYELLTGRPPFVGNTHHQLWYQHCHVQPPLPRSINPLIPKDLDAVLLGALSKNPKARYRSIRAFAQAFRKAIHNSGNIIPLNPDEELVSLAASSPLLPTVSAPDVNKIRTLQPRKKSIFTGRAFLQFSLILAFLIGSIGIMGSIGFFSFLGNTQIGTDNAHATVISSKSTSSANTAIAAANDTATAVTKATRTAQRGATATAQIANANATFTANAQANTNATATASAQAQANANATATAQAQAINATATASAYATTVAYGSPALNDPLQNNNLGHNWDIIDTQGRSCAFTGGSYHASISQKGYISPCFAQANNFINFYYQVQMTIVKGDQGGIAFSTDLTMGTFYYFHINKNGSFALEKYSTYSSTGTITQGTNSAINSGLNQPNLIGVEAIDGNFNLYVNMQKIASVSDSSYTQGLVGVVAEDTGDPTDVAFTNAEVWSR